MASTHRCVCIDPVGEEKGIEGEAGHKDHKLEHGEEVVCWGVEIIEVGECGWLIGFNLGSSTTCYKVTRGSYFSKNRVKELNLRGKAEMKGYSL